MNYIIKKKRKMGNCSNKTESSFNLYDTFKNTGMQEPWAKQYENNFEISNEFDERKIPKNSNPSINRE
jgi:hypothetical protein